ncbi:caspase-8 [Danio aesculapii]|uniref:caspase-8 n=1 Tax=Danio aesculapii TaxID=1142201 RepID=UPI0024BF72DD|nr:caspase-8 [Danio aesculapii]
MEMCFQSVLLKVQESLSADELQDLLFLCSDLLCLRDLNTVSSGQKLFTLLQEQDLLSLEDPSLLMELLRITKRTRLIRSLQSDACMQTNGTADQPQQQQQQRISRYRQFLYELSESICDQDLKNIKFLLMKTLSRRKLEQNLTLLQLFLEMEKEDLLGENNLDVLQRIFADVYPALGKKINQYREENLNVVFIAEETEGFSSKADLPSSQTSLPSVEILGREMDGITLTKNASGFSRDNSQRSDSVNSGIDSESSEMPQIGNSMLEQYEMKGEWRGVCLIINNYDFSACGMGIRDGTDIDHESLRDVFEWLGFEILTRRNCTREQILKALMDLSARDHTQADCVVCCILSHGRLNGIVGVDGQLVFFKELMATLSPLRCSSLYGKPKLFFIQACRGTQNQRPVFPQTFTEDEDVLASDAGVPRDSIPEMADYLMAMSTVPLYASFRDKNNGTWFIQSLCHNLRLLVPRGKDLLSILTKVNADVSRKSDKSGLKKQMPQPEFSLTKTVVFPPPALP